MSGPESGSPAADVATPRTRSWRPWLERGLPAVVSLGALTWLFTTFDLRALLAALDARVARVMLPALAFYGAATLLLEAVSIRRLLTGAPASFTTWTAARSKAASYLLGIVHFALGGAGLAILLRRRTGVSLGECAGVVLLLMFSDLLITLFAGAIGAATGEIETAGLSALAIGGVAGALVLGVAVMRAPFSLGPLERIRALPVFVALRHTPLERLLELALLRSCFVACFIAIGGISFYAFGIEPGVSRVIVGMMILALVAALPIAISGLGTGQVTAVYLFQDLAPAETILAMGLVLSFGLLTLRLLIGVVFAREYVREALAAARAAT